MPSRGSALAVAVASTTLSPMRTTAAPWACLANFPVSNESCFPPARSTITVLTSGFIFHPSYRDRAYRDQESGRASRLRMWDCQSLFVSHGRRVRPWDERVPQELGRPLKIRTLELAQCRTGFERKAVSQRYVQDSRDGSSSLFPPFSQEREKGAPTSMWGPRFFQLF